jgi:hypothetical protein
MAAHNHRKVFMVSADLKNAKPFKLFHLSNLWINLLVL